MIRSSLASLFRLVLQEACSLCGALLEVPREKSFCSSCMSDFPIIRSPLCVRCGLPFSSPEGEDHLCGECLLSPPPFSLSRSLGRYEGLLLDAVHRFKYRRTIPIGEGLGRLMATLPLPGISFSSFDLVLPVPLHRKKLQERGFNQSAVLAKAISRFTSLPLDLFSFRRSGETKPQASLSGRDRAENVRGAFAVSNPPSVEGKRLLLVDDVFTTGSTLREGVRELLRMGAADVAVLTAARAVPRFMGG